MNLQMSDRYENIHCGFDDNWHYLGLYIELGCEVLANWKEPDSIVMV